MNAKDTTTTPQADGTPVRVWIGSEDHRTPAQRLAGMCSGDRGSVLAAKTEQDRIAALIAANPAGTARLLDDIRGRDAGVTVLPQQQPRRTRRRRCLTGTTAVVAAVAVLAPAPSASAAVIPHVQRVTVTASSPVTRISTAVTSTTAIGRDGGHVVTLLLGDAVLRGTARGQGARTVRVAGDVPSAMLLPGTSTATLIDGGDLTAAPLSVTVLRQSAVAITSLVPVPGGVRVTGRASHYDLPSGTYRGDTASPVQVQVSYGAGWVTAATATTRDTSGTVSATVCGAGRLYVRLVRPAGATVTGGTSRWSSAVAAGDVPRMTGGVR